MKLLNGYPLQEVKKVKNIACLIPSLHLGGSFYRRIFPRKAAIVLYLTNRCNSRCIMCGHWQQRPKYDLAVEVIEKLLHDKNVDSNSFLIEGGEALLHPKIEEILALFKDRRYVFLSNGLLPERLARLVEKFKISQVVISLDGDRKTYKKIRGVDGYDKVLQAVSLLKGKTDLGLAYTITPWNNLAGFLHVKKICEENKISLCLSVFANMEYMGQNRPEIPIDPYFDKNENLYITYYNSWVNGQVNIPCFFMRISSIIHPNGDVILCQRKNIVLGNLYKRSFSQIWNSGKTIAIQKKHQGCNLCWTSSHRSFDVKLVKLLDTLFPRFMVRRIIGEYQL